MTGVYLELLWNQKGLFWEEAFEDLEDFVHLGVNRPILEKMPRGENK